MDVTEPTLFRWTGGPDQTGDPTWVVDALQAGDLEFINDGTPNVRLTNTRTGQTAKPGDFIALRNNTIRVLHAGVTPSACRHCGTPEREHMQRWNAHAGWHKWVAPTQEQRLDRMKARALEGEQ